MLSLFLRKATFCALIILSIVLYAGVSHAHTGGGTLDSENMFRNFTGQAQITCFDDGNGPADHVIVRIRDNSPPVPNLLVNLQVYKGNKANSISDTTSGDANFSPFITLQAGPGVYWILVNKTDVGTRFFEIEWHCNTIDSVHTGTDIGVTQFGIPEFKPR